MRRRGVTDGVGARWSSERVDRAAGRRASHRWMGSRHAGLRHAGPEGGARTGVLAHRCGQGSRAALAGYGTLGRRLPRGSGSTQQSDCAAAASGQSLRGAERDGCARATHLAVPAAQPVARTRPHPARPGTGRSSAADGPIPVPAPTSVPPRRGRSRGRRRNRACGGRAGPRAGLPDAGARAAHSGRPARSADPGRPDADLAGLRRRSAGRGGSGSPSCRGDPGGVRRDPPGGPRTWRGRGGDMGRDAGPPDRPGHPGGQ